ncbi:MAG: NAD(P)H-dependent oxidoreductase [Verrucomicrobiales bacterium]|nr:NAD(P)H-dependent oxidoreductase [Verrucomicrobiales bacterium]
MKVLIIRGNPRKNGFTQYLTDEFRRGLTDVGAQVTDIDLASHDIKPCLGCYYCWLTKPGTCVHHDPMSGILEEVLKADVLVCATPVYYFAMSSYLKNFFERTFPLTTEGLELSAMNLLRNQLRYPDQWKGKKFISITVGALPSREAYEPINQTFRLIADTLDLELGGQLTRPESHLLPYRLSKPMTLKRVESAFVRAGHEAGTTGRLSETVMTDAALPLSTNDTSFRTYSNVYWENAHAIGARNVGSSALIDRVAKEPEILMREMARTIDPRTTAHLKVVLQFDFPDQDRHYRLTVDCGKCVMTAEPTEKPDLRVTCTTDIWVALFMRQLDVGAALRQRVIVLEGDKGLFTRLGRYFPPPAV